LEGVETAIVSGIVDESIHLSARSTDSRIHIGRVLDEAFEDVGSAGGHREMAGWEVPLGIFSDAVGDNVELVGIVEGIVTARLSACLNLRSEE
jgi:nanoRNase/pAp phosphatase (c-di-AMP/oligoRNAs hydrolase)